MAAMDLVRPTQHPALERSRIRSAWLLLMPMLIVLFLIAGWPLLRTIWFSFTDASLANPGIYTFVGWKNYLSREDGQWYGLLADPTWWLAVKNTFYFAVISVSLETVLGMIIALVLYTPFRGRGIVRAAVLIPWAVPTIVSAKMWGWMLNDQFGIVNHILMTLGVISHPLAWTASPDLAKWSVIMVDVWKTTPFMTLLILAALQMLPIDCYEAARVDGVHPVKLFFYVTLPLIRPAVMVAVIFRLLDALRIFDLVYVLTSNNQDTMTMSVYARQQLISFQDIGYGSAASTVLFMIVALSIIVYLVVGQVRLDQGHYE